ncbi:cell division protein SepF [Rhodococcus tukisamuensis]|uniref:Cell division protein SepF n=1 Tax=Rhodococcus tukisamuensis TaxID=168276 RepID=A0A1G7BH30_9NOCA|nr:cell division protein SepF [Rhodococcus tukisamuensis]SDE26292.1 cell division inhibitor SepF [Rhodococcus tukisamuensis]
MSTLHKFKAYFGMVPLDDYEDDYLEEPRRSARADRYEDGVERGYDDGYDAREDLDPVDRQPAPRRMEPLPTRTTPRPGVGVGARTTTTRGSLAVDARTEARIDARRAPIFDEGGPLSKITTLRPRDYGEARIIGERFRDGTPVIMDLVEMSNADAKRLVDFAAGLAFALRGSFDKVATKVFLLSPADIDVSAEERRRIAENGFYNQK